MNDIFISYRRKDSRCHAGRLCDLLRRHLGDDKVFMDEDGIPWGEKFLNVIGERISSCSVFLVVIGKYWSSAQSRARLFQPNDTVRLEILAALGRGVLVIPVLVAGGTMPPRFSLPESIADLVAINARTISEGGFREDVAELVDFIKKSLANMPPMDHAKLQLERKRVEGLLKADLARNRTDGPHFGQLDPDRTKFKEKHVSDAVAWRKMIGAVLRPRPFPRSRGDSEPILRLSDALGPNGSQAVRAIQKAGKIVFHAVGSTGNIHGPADMVRVTDRMLDDFGEPAKPSFLFHLGDVVYMFGESKYYYDQFYVPYRQYPAPIFAIAGNHDGMVVPGSHAETLQAFLANFCAEGFHETGASRGLGRTAQIQPGVYFTFEAPWLRILALYSNVVEGQSGVISDEGGKFAELNRVQLEFLETALRRVKREQFKGAVIIVVHHDCYSPQRGSSSQALADLDSVSKATGVWPHAVLSAHAHNYQRYTRTIKGAQIPHIVAGNGGYGVASFSWRGKKTAVPKRIALKDDNVVLQAYDDRHYGYLRITVDQRHLTIDYQPVSSTISDSVTVDLKSRNVAHKASR
jgi:hypothetical protein